MTMLGLLGAVAGGVGEGMQKRRAQERALNLSELDHKLSLELETRQRAWEQEDLQEQRAYDEEQLAKVSAGLPEGVVAVPSGMKVTDTRRKATGGTWTSTGKLSALQKEQIKAVKDARDKAEERYLESTDPEQQKRFMAEYQQYNNQYHSMIGMPVGQAASGAEGTGQPAPKVTVESFLGGFGLPTKEEAKGGAKTEATPKQASAEDAKQERFQKKLAARQVAQKEKSAEIDKFTKTTIWREALKGNEKAKRAVRSKLQKIRRNADTSVIQRIDKLLAEM